MNKIINKALFYKEWINVRWVTLLTIVILLFYKVTGVISALNLGKISIKHGGIMPNPRWFNNGLYGSESYYFVMAFIVIVLAIILFIGEKTSETKGFIASMPFTRKEIILNKWFVGVVSILVSFVVTYIILSLIYVTNINIINTTVNPYLDIVKMLFIDGLLYICIFTFMILIQTIMGNSIVAGVVGGVILCVPLFIATVVQSEAGRWYVFSRSRQIAYDKICGWINIYTYNLPRQDYVSATTNTWNIYYVNYKSKLLVLFILTCLFLYLAYVAYKKKNIEYNLRLIVFKNLKPVFMLGFAICFGLLIGLIFGEDSRISGLREFRLITIIFTIIGYFISKFLIKVLSSGK